MTVQAQQQVSMFLLGLGLGASIVQWLLPRLRAHRHTFSPTGYWVPVGGGHRWFHVKCACGHSRIVSTSYDNYEWDEVDEIRLRAGEWRYDPRVRDAKDIVEELTNGH